MANEATVARGYGDASIADWPTIFGNQTATGFAFTKRSTLAQVHHASRQSFACAAPQTHPWLHIEFLKLPDSIVDVAHGLDWELGKTCFMDHPSPVLIFTQTRVEAAVAVLAPAVMGSILLAQHDAGEEHALTGLQIDAAAGRAGCRRWGS